MHVGLAVGLLAGLIIGSDAAADKTGVGATVYVVSPPAHAWPQFHHDSLESGYSPDPLMTDNVAPLLGVRWMANLTAAALSSPVVAWNAPLGKTVVYAGSEAGYLSAFDEATGQTLWSINLGSALRSTPVIEGNFIWAAPTYAPKLYKINAATGAISCSTMLTNTANGSPVVGTPPGGQKTVYIGLNDLGTASGPLYGINESNCAVNFQFTNYAQVSGSWDGLTFALDKNNRALVLVGTSDHDAGIYAIDAVTGALVWHFQTINASGLADVGAGITVTPPGTNGFADGAAYGVSKDGNLYALDLTTGVELWRYNYAQGLPVVGNGARSTASVIGNQVIFGTTTGVFDVNATTGTLNWQYAMSVEVLGSVAIIGPPGHEVVAFDDVAGQVHVISLSTQASLFTYQTANYIAASIADVDGNLLVTSADGFLYDFAARGANGAAPTTAVTSPAAGSTVPNPNGNLTIQGTATAPNGVEAVNVDVQMDGSTGPWWNAKTSTWNTGSVNNPAVLGSPGATSSTWSLSVPMPTRGTVLQVIASAVDSDGIADTSADRSGGGPGRVAFSVAYSTTAPTVQTSASRVAPGTAVTVNGGGYQANESVVLTLPTQPVTTLATVTAGSTGMLPTTPVTFPVSIPFGPISLIATGTSSTRTSSIPMYVSNNWDQWHDTASKTGFEVNDSALNNDVGANGKSFLDQAWAFPSGSTIHSSPSIDQGVAFFGNDAGTFYAINVTNSAPLWSRSFTSGIDSSAAVDGGLVIFGTEGGSVVALNEATGKTVWTTLTAGAVESSPAVAGGVVYVGADDGSVYALTEGTGVVQWTSVLGGAVHSSPTVATSKGLIVVGDDTGKVTALNQSTGAVVWQDATGAAVTATPIYFSNNIYVGSTDGTMYAFVAKTGAPVWTFLTGGPITASAVTFGKSIGVGSADGTVYYLDSNLGTEVNSLPGTVPIVGLGGSINFVVAVTSKGTAFASRVTGADQTWKWVSTAAIASSPTLVNGTVYISGLDMALHAFTAPGRPVE